MGDTKYSIEKTYKVWDDKEGVYIEVGPDSDTGSLVQVSTEGNPQSMQYYGRCRVVMEPEMARLLADALYSAADDMEKANG